MSGRRSALLVVLSGALHRWRYRVAMYTGLRALRNSLRSRAGCLDARLRRLDGTRLRDDGVGELCLSVHPRSHPRRSPAGGNHGLLSLRLRSPDVGRWTYRYFCATSHFGCGHVEIAFFEHDGRVTFYGVRNIARANAARLGLTRLSDRLRLRRSDEDAHVLGLVAGALARAGIAVCHAEAQECLDLAVDERLLAPSSVPRTRRSLYRKYARLCERMRASAAQSLSKNCSDSRVAPSGAAPGTSESGSN